MKIGFAVRDVAGRGCAFQLDEQRGDALVFGSTSALRVCAPGVLPAHFVVMPHEGRLLAASASASHPAAVNGVPLPTAWTVLEVPARVRLGAAAVDFFFVREMLADTDVETTVARAPLGPRRPPEWPAMSAHDVAGAAWLHARTRWSGTSTSTRVALGVTALLVIFFLGRAGAAPP